MNSFKINLTILLCAGMMLTSCDNENNCIQGHGGSTSRTLAISDFTGIDFQMAGEVILTQGAIREVIAVGDANVVDHIDTDVSNGEWNIDFDHGCYDNYDLTIYITVPELNEITLSGSGDITVNDFDNQKEDLDILLSGSGTISLHNFDGAENLTVNISGSGTITSYGTIPTLKYQHIKISGSGNYKGFNNLSDYCSINIPGSGNCEVQVLQTLDVKISGSGNVYYKGHPTVTSDISGSGSVLDVN